MRVFIKGDCHGDFDFLEEFCRSNSTSIADVLIILGDAGILYYGAHSQRECLLKQYITNKPITLFCIRGNHEDRPENRKEMIKEKRFGNYVYYDANYPNILYAIDGLEYKINNQSYLALGGAYSVDKHYRIAYNWKWNPNEQLSSIEMDTIEEQIEGKNFDYILSHTCPYSWQPTYLFIQGIDQNSIDHTMEYWLEDIFKECKWREWWFGHYHENNMDVCGDGKVHMLFNEIKEIKNE